MSVTSTKQPEVRNTDLPEWAERDLGLKPEPRALAGLCRTCNHAVDCVYIRNAERPVTFCEEFDSYTPPTIEELMADQPAPTVEDMKLWDEYKGLCANCELRKTCTIRNTETGVWHCEEYA